MTSKRFAILVYDDVEPIDVGATFGVLSIARRVVPEIEMFLVASKAGPVRLTNGLIVQAHYGYENCPVADVLIITGGPGWQAQCEAPDTLDFIRRRSAESAVASVCTGGMILAASGLLDGMAATTRRRGPAVETVTPLQAMATRYPRVRPVEALVIDHGAVATGGGVTLGIDMMLHLLERFFGAEATEQITTLLEYGHARKANAAHFNRQA